MPSDMVVGAVREIGAAEHTGLDRIEQGMYVRVQHQMGGGHTQSLMQVQSTVFVDGAIKLVCWWLDTGRSVLVDPSAVVTLEH